MAQGLDEDDIWNYTIKGTSKIKTDGIKTRTKTSPNSDDLNRHSQAHHKCPSSSNAIVIDSDDDDDGNVFQNRKAQRRQQTEQWKFLSDKGHGKNNGPDSCTTVKGGRKGNRNTHIPSSSIGKPKEKSINKKRISQKGVKNLNPKTSDGHDKIKSDLSSSPNSLNYLNKKGKCKRKSLDDEEIIIPFNEGDDPSLAIESGLLQAKRRSLVCEDEYKQESPVTVETKENIENDFSYSPLKQCSIDKGEISRNGRWIKSGSDKDSDEDDVKVCTPQVVDVIVLEEEDVFQCVNSEKDVSQCHDSEKDVSQWVDSEKVESQCVASEKDIHIVERGDNEEERLQGGFFVDGETELSDSDMDDRLEDSIVIKFGNGVKNYNENSKSCSRPKDDCSKILLNPKTSVYNNDLKKQEFCVSDSDSNIEMNDLATPSSGASDLLNSSSLSPLKARKQTSLFSFFKARPSLSATGNFNPSKNSDSDTMKKSVFAGVTSRPSLRPYSSVGTASSSKFKSNSSSERSLPQAEEKKTYSKNKQCPFYKKMPGTSITVDAFKYGVIPQCQAYFLTHFHYDHYGGLTKKFAQPIFCSQVTGNLVESRLGVHSKWINRLPMWKPCPVADATLTLMEANHCPGAVIVLFETKDGKKILHTGDFRACDEMESYAPLRGIGIDELYLDTTYCNPSHAFPSQREVIDFVVSVVEKHVAAHPKTLIVCGAYTIGKEKIFHAIAKALDSKICVMGDKKKVLDCLDDTELRSRLTVNWSQGQVHVLPMGRLNQKALFDHHQRHSQYTSILAFQPTGWTHSSESIGLASLRPKWSSNGVTLYGVPYSEHSSFLELKQFVQFFRAKKILPTVNNGNPASRQKMEDIFKEWEDESKSSSIGKTSLTSHLQPKMDSWMA